MRSHYHPRQVMVDNPSNVTGDLIGEGYGDPDDHLRLSVLLAERLDKGRTVAPDCFRKTASWEERFAALEALLHSVPSDGMVFWDIDALYTTSTPAQIVERDDDTESLSQGNVSATEAWNDSQFTGQRRRFFQLIVETAQRRSWTLVRPAPRFPVNAELSEFQLEDEADDEVSALNAFSPEVRPMARWLIERGTLSPRALGHLVREVAEEHLNDEILETIYDVIPPSTRQALLRLSILRPSVSVNGHVGPFDVGSDLQADDVDVLSRCGALQSISGTRARVRVPRLVRSRFRKRALSLFEERFKADNLRAASSEKTDSAQKIEAHHHAIAAGDVEAAVKTSDFYGADLRELAIALSLRGEYREASEVYRTIVSDFDNTDAYAWEYMGYNLERTINDRLLPSRVERDVRKAYERACKFDAKNPLYMARLIQLKARLGEDIVEEFGATLNRVRSYAGYAGVCWFAVPVLHTLRYWHIHEILNGVLRRWPELSHLREGNRDR